MRLQFDVEMSAGVPRCAGEPSPTSTRTIASPSCRTGICSGWSTCALGSTSLSFMHEDEGVDLFVRRPARGQRLQDRHAHHPDQRRVLHEDRFSLRLLDLLSHQLSQAQEEERKILANALHDDTIQILTAAMLRLDMLGHRQSDPKVGADLRALSEQLVDAIKRCRHLPFVLRPPALDRDGLKAAVEELVRRARTESEIRSSLEFDSVADPGEHVNMVVFRVLDEAIRNVQKHSRAATLQITISDRMHGST